MVKIILASADKLLAFVVPAADARAACSGSFFVCGGACRFGGRQRYRCTYKANCTDTCYAYDCAC